MNDIAELAQSERLSAMAMLRNLPGTDLNVVGLPISFDTKCPYLTTDSPPARRT